MATYKIPPAMSGNGKGWGGVAPAKAKKAMVKEFKKDSGGVKGMSSKTAKIDKAARKKGF